MNSHAKKGSLLEGRWVDVSAAVLIALSSLMFVLAMGHGVAVLYSFVLDAEFFSRDSILCTPFGTHLRAGIGLLVASPLPIGTRTAARWLAVAVSLSATVWLFSVTEWRSAFVVSAIPNVIFTLMLAIAAVIVHHSPKKRELSYAQ